MQQESPGWLESGAGEKTSLGDKCVMGRSPECQLVIKSARASRRHAMIYKQGRDEFWLADLGSANGTRLNGRHVSRPCRLADGDRLELAGFTFVFRHPHLSKGRDAELSRGPSTLPEVRTFDCWLLVADIVGSTALVRKLDAEKAAAVTSDWLTRCRAIIDEHHGLINKFLGDGFLAYWSEGKRAAPQVLAALKALEVLQAQAETNFRVVLHYGKAIAGGAPTLGEESLAGKDVTFVFRMEELASSLGATFLLSEPAAQHLEPLHTLRAEGVHRLNGFENEYQFFAL
jgi:class 3 adenylate cyclase